MNFFREYLKENKILHDPRFDVTDEDFLVQALLQARMNKSSANIVIKAGFFGKRDLEKELKTQKPKDALYFVAAFLEYQLQSPGVVFGFGDFRGGGMEQVLLSDGAVEGDAARDGEDTPLVRSDALLRHQGNGPDLAQGAHVRAATEFQ